MEAAEWFIPKLQINLVELLKAAAIHILVYTDQGQSNKCLKSKFILMRKEFHLHHQMA
jgi:hypothetical protein